MNRSRAVRGPSVTMGGDPSSWKGVMFEGLLDFKDYRDKIKDWVEHCYDNREKLQTKVLVDIHM